MVTANSATRESSGTGTGRIRVMKDTPHRLSSSPSTVAAADRIIASARTWRTTRHRVAPTARRTVQSRTRRLDRAMTRLAAFTQAIASTSIGTAMYAAISVPCPEGLFSMTGSTDTRARGFGRVASSRSRNAAASARTCSSSTPRRRRPTYSSNSGPAASARAARPSGPRSASSPIAIGTQISGDRALTPMKLRGATPTISSAAPFTSNCRPIADGARS